MNLLKELYSPNILIPRRLRMVKNIVALGLLMCVGTTWKLWTSNRLFPQVPFFDFGFSVPKPYDLILFGVFALSLLFLLFSRFKRAFIVCTILLSITLILLDQNRLQPWMFMFLLILLVLGFYNWRVDEPKNHTSIYTTLTIIIAATYFWSGVQKLNPNFMTHTWQWLIQPLQQFLTPAQSKIAYNLGFGVPYVELLLGIGLLIPQFKKVVIPALIAMHLVIIVLLSPLFHNYNPVVWGWNLAMILLIYTLFAGKVDTKFRQLSYLVEFKPVFAIVIICFVLPSLNLFNKWDSYLSANLYSGNTAQVQIYLTEKAKNKLPYYIQLYTEKLNSGIYGLNIKGWALGEIGVPGYPEPRVFNAIHKHIQQITCCDDEVTLFVNPKKGLLKDA